MFGRCAGQSGRPASAVSRSAPKRRATCSTPSRASSTGSDSCRWPRPGPGCLTSDPAVAADLLGAALRLWRGRALADVADGLTALAGRIAGLEEARRTALYLRIDADLAAGRHHKLAGSWLNSPRRTRCASGSVPSRCWSCTGVTNGQRRSRLSRRPGLSWPRSSASIPVPIWPGCTRQSCGLIRDWRPL